MPLGRADPLVAYRCGATAGRPREGPPIDVSTFDALFSATCFTLTGITPLQAEATLLVALPHALPLALVWEFMTHEG